MPSITFAKTVISTEWNHGFELGAGEEFSALAILASSIDFIAGLSFLLSNTSTLC
jgi:hypothetical protein